MIVSSLTNGFGNNLFQCVAGKILAHYHNKEHYFIPETSDYTCTSYLKTLGFKELKNFPNEKFVLCNENNYQNCFDKKLANYNILLKGYFENKDYYVENRSLIKSWFPKLEKNNSKDLVLHLRTGDRLFYKNEFDFKPGPKSFESAMSNFNFEKLYIVTDMYDWKKHTPESISSLNFHVQVPTEKSVTNEKAAEYFNELYEFFSDYNPIIKSDNVLNDFNFIRGFDNILFQHGTMSWWASFVSQASKVGVYGPWREWKGNSNKNLSDVDLEGWFKWE